MTPLDPSIAKGTLSQRDLDTYFVRIGYHGPREATLAALTEIHFHHVCAIPFENLDVLLGRGIRLDLDSVVQKLVYNHRGGYCFEQNGLFAAVLRALGFKVTPLIGRVRWQVPLDVVTGLTHMMLHVEAKGDAWIADVGFGSMSLFHPLALEFDREQTSSLEPRRLVRNGDRILQQARLGDTWHDVYYFTLAGAPSVDFEVGNWFTSTHPNSRFTQNLTAARGGHGHRRTLFNREFTTRYADGRTEKRDINTPDELLQVLAEGFGLHFPPGTRFGHPGAPWPV